MQNNQLTKPLPCDPKIAAAAVVADATHPYIAPDSSLCVNPGIAAFIEMMSTVRNKNVGELVIQNGDLDDLTQPSLDRWIMLTAINSGSEDYSVSLIRTDRNVVAICSCLASEIDELAHKVTGVAMYNYALTVDAD